MNDKLTIEKCRSLIGNDHKYSDSQIVEIRDALYSVGTFVVNKFVEIKRKFTTRVQTVSCRGFIVK